ncbi:kinase-like protein [Phanerochaete sordida]|uniref:Kinase-like protein n=1 Tax=Phanerochaete sordida TaxID=48140 RepID=A0A9P3GFZ7_9APHY|nr:kinase-like protein [Phanerochaete sordida]
MPSQIFNVALRFPSTAIFRGQARRTSSNATLARWTLRWAQCRPRYSSSWPSSPARTPPIKVGSTVRDRYEVLHCLARQKHSTIWLVKDADAQFGQYLAMKVQSPHKPLPPCGCSGAQHLITMADYEKDDHSGAGALPILLDAFALPSPEGPDGRAVECLVMPLFGESIRTLYHPGARALPWDVLKQVCISLCFAVDFLHVKGVVHTDIHPDNILIQPKARNETAVVEAFLAGLDPTKDHVGPVPFPKVERRELSVALTDLENAHLVANDSKHDFLIQPHHLRAPEVILGAPWGPKADIWNLGCLIFEWATSRLLFEHDTETGDPQAILRGMVHTLGNFPPALIAQGRHAHKWFNSDGSLMSPPKHVGLGLETLIFYGLMGADDYRPPLPSSFNDHELALFMDFLHLMVRLDPEERWSGIELVGHPWLHDTLGEIIEVMREEEAERNARS